MRAGTFVDLEVRLKRPWYRRKVVVPCRILRMNDSADCLHVEVILTGEDIELAGVRAPMGCEGLTAALRYK